MLPSARDERTAVLLREVYPARAVSAQAVSCEVPHELSPALTRGLSREPAILVRLRVTPVESQSRHGGLVLLHRARMVETFWSNEGAGSNPGAGGARPPNPLTRRRSLSRAAKKAAQPGGLARFARS